MKTIHSRIATLTVGFSAAVGALVSAPAQAALINISQIYGGGGNSGATYTNDFVELFNPGSTAISLSGYTLQYASASGSFSSSSLNTALSGTIQPLSYFLISLASGGSNGAALPTPDVTNTSVNMSATTGKVALVDTSLGSLLTCSSCNPTSSLPQVVDFVGYGGANSFEGSVAPAPSNANSIFRNNSGLTDTNNNFNDFTAAAASPRNSSTEPVPEPITILGGLTALGMGGAIKRKMKGTKQVEA